MKKKVVLGWSPVLIVAMLAMGCPENGQLPEEEERDVEGDISEEDPYVDDRVDGEGEPCRLYDRSGPYPVGVVDLRLSGGEEVAIFYPAVASTAGEEFGRYDMRDFLPEGEREKISDEEAPFFEMNAVFDAEISEEGPFPVVLFSHGLGGYRYQSSQLLGHLASWGFVVASAEQPERNLAKIVENLAPEGDETAETMRTVLAYLGEQNGESGSWLEGRLDISRVGVSGHSMGGGGTASMLGEPGVRAAIFYASGREVTENHGAEVMWQSGSTDSLARTNQVRTVYENAPATKRFLDIKSAGHLAFSDLCAIGADRGGVLQIAVDNGIEVPPIIMVLGADGCRETDLPAEDGWPMIHHYSVAHYRSAFGIDQEPVGLSAATTACFEELAELEWAEE